MGLQNDAVIYGAGRVWQEINGLAVIPMVLAEAMEIMGIGYVLRTTYSAPSSVLSWVTHWHVRDTWRSSNRVRRTDARSEIR